MFTSPRNKQQVAVLGLGRFGSAVVRELTRLGHDVLAVDRDPRVVRERADEVTSVVEADATDGDALRERGLADFDVAIVAIGSSPEASVLATALLRRLGLARIIAIAESDIHASILEQVGATRVLSPEQGSGLRVAHSFAAPGVRDYLDVAPGYGFAISPVTPAQAGKSLRALDLPGVCGGALLALRRGGRVILHPDDQEILRPGDGLVVAGRDADLERLPAAGAE